MAKKILTFCGKDYCSVCGSESHGGYCDCYNTKEAIQDRLSAAKLKRNREELEKENEKLKRDNKRLEQIRQLQKRYLQNLYNLLDEPEDAVHSSSTKVLNKFKAVFKENELLKEDFNEIESKYLEMYEEIGNALGFNMEDPNHELKDYLQDIDKCIGAEIFEENDKLKVALRKASSELRMIMQQHECEYCNDEDQATWCGNCDPEYFLKEAEKELNDGKNTSRNF